MSQNRTVYAALAIACVALGVALYAVMREPATTAKPSIDAEARAQIEQLRRALTERDALIARLAGTAATPAIPPTEQRGAEPATPEAPTDPGPRRYVQFEIPNPAVTITQKPDGVFDIRTTDPTLSGSVLTITATTKTGEQDKMLIRVP